MLVTEKRIKVFIDNSAWHWLFRFKVELSEALPSEQFSLVMTKQISDFEVDSIPEEKAELKEYISKQRTNCSVEVKSYFGFSSYNNLDHKSRVGGFGEGSYMTYTEGRFTEYFKFNKEIIRPSGLYNNEGDASLAVRACTGNVVLTAEGKAKSGPLKRAAAIGGQVAYFVDFAESGIPLVDVVLASSKKKLVPDFDTW